MKLIPHHFKDEMKIIPLIALVPMILLALTPPWTFSLDCTVNSMAWLWAVLISGFLAFLFIYQQVNIWLKLFVVYAFISCFYSRAPYISFTMFWSLIACAYYYSFCRKIKDWTYIKNSVQAIFYLTIVLVIMQLFGKDTLLNFNMTTPGIVGTIGNRMIFSSFVCCLAPFLILNPLNWIPLWLMTFISSSSGAVMALGLGLATLLWIKVKRARIALITLIIAIPLIYAYVTGDFNVFTKAGRGPVWADACRLIAKAPQGYGIGTWKVLYPVLADKNVTKQQPGRSWNTAHNDFLQIPFEVGIPGLILLAGWIVSIIRNVQNPVKLAGLMILVGTMTVHFPARLCQTVLIILMFLAYAERKEDAIYPA